MSLNKRELKGLVTSFCSSSQYSSLGVSGVRLPWGIWLPLGLWYPGFKRGSWSVRTRTPRWFVWHHWWWPCDGLIWNQIGPSPFPARLHSFDMKLPIRKYRYLIHGHFVHLMCNFKWQRRSRSSSSGCVSLLQHIIFYDPHQGVEAGGSLDQELVALKIIILHGTERYVTASTVSRRKGTHLSRSDEHFRKTWRRVPGHVMELMTQKTNCSCIFSKKNVAYQYMSDNQCPKS